MFTGLEISQIKNFEYRIKINLKTEKYFSLQFQNFEKK